MSSLGDWVAGMALHPFMIKDKIGDVFEVAMTCSHVHMDTSFRLLDEWVWRPGKELAKQV